MIRARPVPPRPVRLYIEALVVLSVIVVIGSLVGLMSGRITGGRGSFFTGFSLLVALATARPIKLRANVYLSLRTAPQLPAAVLLGPALAVLAVGVGVVSGYLYLLQRTRTNRTDLLFNTAQGILSTLVASLCYYLVSGTGSSPLREPVALLLAAGGMHLSNAFLVTTALVLARQSRGFGTTFVQLITSHPLSYATLLITGILAVMLAREAFWTVPLLAVPLVLVERTWLTERAEADRQRAQAEDNARLYHEVQAALNVRDEFLRRAAHELKTPITNLLGYTQLLRHRPTRGAVVGDRDERIRQTIAEQGIRLHRLVVMLLDLSRMEKGQLVIDHQPVELCTLVSRIVEESQLTLKPGMIKVECTDTSVMIDGDELRLEQVLYNLLQNAIKYSSSEQPIQMHVERRGDQACLIVHDEGDGIPPEALPHLFERFYQVPTGHVPQSSGFGIGLFIVHEIVLAHGGRIEVSSTAGQGSTFTVYLPCRAAATAPTADPAPLGLPLS